MLGPTSLRTWAGRVPSAVRTKAPMGRVAAPTMTLPKLVGTHLLSRIGVNRLPAVILAPLSPVPVSLLSLLSPVNRCRRGTKSAVLRVYSVLLSEDDNLLLPLTRTSNDRPSPPSVARANR